MMGPEAALVSDRLADLRALGKYASAVPPPTGAMYAEAAVRAYLEPPTHRPGAWARLRAALHGRGVPKDDGEAVWTVAAAPIAAKEVRAEAAWEKEMAQCLLAALPLRRDARP